MHADPMYSVNHMSLLSCVAGAADPTYNTCHGFPSMSDASTEHRSPEHQYYGQQPLFPSPNQGTGRDLRHVS